MVDTTGRFNVDDSISLHALRCYFAAIVVPTADLWPASPPFRSQEFA